MPGSLNFIRQFTVLFLVILNVLFLFSCGDHKTEEQKKLSNLTIKWGWLTDSLLHDSARVNIGVDSLKRQILEAADDTSALNHLNLLAQEWKNDPNLILAT